ncbi:MAG: hypothetical protein JSU77_04595 [Fidelibacterota bacterium]|nr:MAG: hypothetical protein JSU77_04595 [Candidatus Neomarinimicrobiota bacterium]
MKASSMILLYYLCSSITGPLCGQEEVRALVLRKGNDVVTIRIGDWLAVSRNGGEVVLAAGRLADWDSSRIYVQSDKGTRLMVPISKIGILHHGEARRLWYYTNKGMVYGVLAGATTGLLLSISTFWLADSGDESDFLYIGTAMESLSLLFVPMTTVIYGVCGGGAGSVVGLLAGIYKHRKATVYPIGHGEWDILVE